jgi:hypothetical protein
VISGNILSYTTAQAQIVMTFVAPRRLKYHETFTADPLAAKSATVLLDPVWTLVDAERLAKR